MHTQGLHLSGARHLYGVGRNVARTLDQGTRLVPRHQRPLRGVAPVREALAYARPAGLLGLLGQLGWIAEPGSPSTGSDPLPRRTAAAAWSSSSTTRL